MARAKKMQPAVTRLWFHIRPANTTNYIDLSLAASAVNRRFYRQGTTWAVAGMALHTTSATGQVTVSKVPDTWVSKNSHTKAKSLWMKSQDQVLDNDESVASKYRDFKVYLDGNMVGATVQPVSPAPAGDGVIMLPIDRQNQVCKIGEWEYSTIQIPSDGGANPPTEITLHMVGDDVGNSKAIIHGYAESRSRPFRNDPNIPSQSGWMNDVFDVADNLDEIRQDLETQNDQPPYRVGDRNAPISGQDLTFYPGGPNNMPSTAIHDIQGISTTTVGGKTHINGGMFGCGLIRFDWDITSEAESMYLAVDLVPGEYKGYLTEVY